MENTKGIPLSQVSPAFLNANSTSHTWAFSAIAEIIDNAYDPDVQASELCIDKMVKNDQTCLTFTDNGSGLSPDKLLKMLSFGFCDKAQFEGKSGYMPIGHYGNGFKSGSMRIAKDVLVFTRHLKEQSVGMLSQTFLDRTNSQTVVVPLVTWNNKENRRDQSVETVNNIRAITTYSDFKTEDDLLNELKELEKLQTGTRIILYNLKTDKAQKLELDFESNPTDILNPQTLEIDTQSVYRPVQEALPRYQISLREYCSILFLKPRMKIVLRGLKVKTRLICKSLSYTETDRYKPQWLNQPVKITYGFTCDHDNTEYGIMMYHRNRLIKAFEKVGYQKQPNDLGVGVVGIVEVNFLQPIHNKQDFNKDEHYNTFMAALALKTNEYWNEKKSGTNSVEEIQIDPDWLWAQCDNCLKWRRLPDGINSNLPDKWFCYMNPDASHNRCDIEEEPEDEDLSLQHASYKKTVKKEMEKERRKSKFGENEVLIKKEKELKEREEKLKVQAKAVEKICSDVTSTQVMRKRESDVLKRELELAKLREAKQRRFILQLQAQQNNVQKQKQALCQVAGTFHVPNNDSSVDSSTLLRNSLDPKNRVSSTSGIKRKAGKSPSEPSSKQLIIKNEDTDDVVAIIPEIDEVIEVLSDSDDESHVKPDPKLVKKAKKLYKDVKPNVRELAKQMEKEYRQSELNNTQNNSVTNSDSLLNNSVTNSDSLTNNLVTKNTPCEKARKNAVTATVSIEIQTDDVEFNKSDDSKTQQELETTKSDLKHCEERLKSLQNDVHSLLSIIVPGVDLGEVSEIEKIVGEMIRVNKDSPI